jgi:hypothetical protein
VAYEKFKFERYRGNDRGWFKDEPIDMVQLTNENFGTVKQWLEGNDCEVSYWTNEAFVIGFWVSNTWHDGGSKTPVPFGWWLYKSPHSGEMGAASAVSLEQHYDPA